MMFEQVQNSGIRPRLHSLRIFILSDATRREGERERERESHDAHG